MSVWIQNAYTSDIAIDCKDKVTKQQLFRVVFSAVRVNRLTGRLDNDGYTELEDDKFKTLTENSMSFRKLIKDNKLIKYDEAPVTSMNSAERAVALQAKLAEANAKIQALEARVAELVAEKAASAPNTEVTTEGEVTQNPDGSISAEGLEINDSEEPITASKPKTAKGSKPKPASAK